MKRKDIQALLDKDPETVFFVESWQGRTVPVLVTGFKEAVVRNKGRYTALKVPARVLTRPVRLGNGFDSDRIEQRDGYYLGVPDNPAGYRTGHTFGQIRFAYEGTLAEFIVERQEQARLDEQTKTARNLAAALAVSNGEHLRSAIQDYLGLVVEVDTKGGDVVVTLSAANARQLARIIMHDEDDD